MPCRSLLRFLPSFSYRFDQISHFEPQWNDFSNPPQFLEEESPDGSVTLWLKVSMAWVKKWSGLPYPTFPTMDTHSSAALCSEKRPWGALCREWAPKLGGQLTQKSWWPGPTYDIFIWWTTTQTWKGTTDIQPPRAISKLYIEQKTPHTRKYLLYDFIYIKAKSTYNDRN